MKKNILKFTSFIIAVCLAASLDNTMVSATNTAGAANALMGIETIDNSQKAVTTPLSGMSLVMSEALGETQEPDSCALGDIPMAGAEADGTPVFVEPPKPQVDYAVTAVSLAEEYVNVRQEPSENSQQVGKLYNNCIGTVLGYEGDWTKISSGNVEGYVKNEYLSVGDQNTIDNAVQYHACVTADALKLRSEMSLESKVYSVARNGVKLDVLDDSTFNDGWIFINKGDTNAYVSSSYVDLAYEFDYAESREEELARLALEAENQGVQVANYALQFVGNPYVWGGTSLTRGADCSGFVMSVYAKFGIYLPHSSAADRGVGYGVPINEMKAGDLVCYSGHVGLCIGNGQIVHAASRRSGIKVSSAYYRKILCVRRVL